MKNVQIKKSLNLLIAFSMASFWIWFAYRHMLAFQEGEELSYLLFCISETLTAAFFLFRTTPKTVSTEPFDYFIASGATFLPLFFSPSTWELFPHGSVLILAGTLLQILGLISLNRSFALIAAKRKIKTSGMYQFIRHPMYASYFLIFTGYLLTNTTLPNASIYFITLIFLLIRIDREEKHLSQDDDYQMYMRNVRYRMIPYIY